MTSHYHRTVLALAVLAWGCESPTESDDDLAVFPTSLTMAGPASRVPAPGAFTIVNNDSDSLRWSLSEDIPWLSVLPSSGVLPPAGSHPVTATSVDQTLPPGTYAGQIVVQEVGEAGSSVTIDVTLSLSTDAADPVLNAAGDIAGCGFVMGDDQTANLLDDLPGTVAVLGDLAYPAGSEESFRNCYDPTWGRHKPRSRPVPGNREYDTPGASAYWDYWGTRAGPRDKGWYSFDLGAWHVVALNSEVGMDAGSEQEQWLRSDLSTHQDAVCTLAYFHRPRFNSGVNGQATRTQGAWDALYDFGADVVLTGHSHTYERFALQDPAGVADPANGIRQFVVGTGGRGNGDFGVIRANSEVRYNADFAVLSLVLSPGSYSWELLAVDGSTPDAGSDVCR